MDFFMRWMFHSSAALKSDPLVAGWVELAIVSRVSAVSARSVPLSRGDSNRVDVFIYLFKFDGFCPLTTQR